MSTPTTGDKTRRVFWRVMPFLMAAYLIFYIDRVNVGFPLLQTNKAVGIDPKTYGLGAGIFLIGYSYSKCPATWGWRSMAPADGSPASWCPRDWCRGVRAD